MIEFYNLPLGWSLTSLGELVLSIQYGYTASATEQAIGPKFLRITDLQNNSVNWDTVPFCPCDEIDKYKLKKGDIVIARTGATTGKSFLLNNLPEVTVFASYLIRLETSNLCPPEYIALFMQCIDYWRQITVVSKGTAQPGANASILSKLSIPIPPLNEQHRIVAKIEALKARSQRVKEELEAIPALLDQFRQSVLAAAFRGDLTADWREKNPDVEPASVLLERTSEQLNQNLEEVIREINKERNLIPNSWAWTKLKLVVKNIQAGKNFSCPEIPVTEDTVGLVKISAVTWGKFDYRETKTVIDSSKIDPNLFIQPDDFLISRANTIELVGAPVVVEEINYKIMLSDKVWRVDFLEVDKKYINFYLKSAYGRKEIESRATGNQLSMRNLSQNAFRDIVIALPPLKEQQEIVCRLETFFKAADQVKQQYQESQAYLDQLNQSILAKAFRGELVSQDLNDEPASVLLERIRAEREKLDTKKKAKGKTEKTSRKAKPEPAEPEQLSFPGFE